MKPPVVLATLVLDLLLALAPPIVTFVFSSPPVVLTLTPRSLLPAPPVFAVAGRPGAIASSIIRAIDSAVVGAIAGTGAVAVAPIAIRPVAPISVVPATLLTATTFLQQALLLLSQLLISALIFERPALLVILAAL
ncbi:MAG TPA: hypothetical protein VFX97_02950 [Pyrinomonadaceae bacterium]|nr:hypothetical protein [Pyrinomonadaceae bacterium]